MLTTTNRSSFRALAAGLLLIAAALCPRPGLAGDRKSEARLHFDQGVQLFRDGDFQAASIEFRRAYDAEPNFRVLYNIGQACAEAKDYACALSSFSTYLQQGGPDVPTARRVQLEQQMDKLKIRTGRLTIRTNMDGASILIDDTTVGRSPIDVPLLVSAGRRKVAVVSPTGVQQIRTVEVAGGDDMTVDLPFPTVEPRIEVRPPAFDVAKDAPLEPESETAARAAASNSRTTRIAVPAAITLVLATGAGVSGYLALKYKHDFDDAIATRPGDRDTIEDKRSRTRAWALSTDLFTGAAIVGGVFTLLAILRGPSEDEPQEGATTSLLIGPGSVGVLGRF